VVRLWVANTDHDWFDFLSIHRDLDEVNFWQPSGSSGFAAIQPGELFLFRLKAPRNAIGGYGVFSHASNLPISLVWDAFGVKNGAPNLVEMRLRVEHYRRERPTFLQDYTIGCRIVTQPVFLPESLWIKQPASWGRSIVVGKTYSTEEREGLELWDQVSGRGFAMQRSTGGLEEAQARYGEPSLIAPRLGQGAFRISVIDAYARQCAVSGGKVLPALDAAHIQPYARGGIHSLSNGVLVRRDIHSVLDAGYATIDDNYRFVVSDRVRTDFDNGNEYHRLHGSPLILPSPSARPSPAALRWHNENIFLG
jgi:putative restriction endonuclease